MTCEISWGYLASIDEGKGGSVGEHASELLHQVKGQGGASRSIAVKETALRIQAAALARAAAIAGEKGVIERKQRVDGIKGRPSVSPVESKGALLLGDQVVEYREELNSTFALIAPNNLQI